MSEARKARFIEPVNKLARKVIADGPLAIDDAALKRVERSLGRLAEEYITVVGNDLSKLQEAIDRLDETSADQSENLKNTFLISHKIKGMGGSFNYGLVSLIAASLCQFIESLNTGSIVGAMKVMSLHLDGLNVVIGSEIKGDGGQTGEDLLTGLSSVIAKFNEPATT